MKMLGIKKNFDKNLEVLMRQCEEALLQAYTGLLENPSQYERPDTISPRLSVQSYNSLNESQLDEELFARPIDFLARLQIQQIAKILCGMLPMCKLRKSVYIFGTQSRKVVMDASRAFKVEVAVSNHGMKREAGYETIHDYLT